MAINRKLRVTLILVLLAVFFYSAFQLLVIYLDYRENEQFYAAAQAEFVTLPDSAAPGGGDPGAGGTGGEGTGATGPAIEPEPYDPSLWYMDVAIDFDRLQESNKEIVGWIMVPGNKINYPLVRGRDNQKYLTRASDNTYSKLGSIFMDYRNSGDLTDRHTIIYGHNTKNGAMFGALHEFRDEAYLAEHPQFFIFTEEGVRIYEIFSAYVTDAYSDTYRLDLASDRAYTSWLGKMSRQSQAATGVEVTAADRVVTLSTCTSSGLKTERFVIQGRLVEPAMAAPEQAAAAL